MTAPTVLRIVWAVASGARKVEARVGGLCSVTVTPARAGADGGVVPGEPSATLVPPWELPTVARKAVPEVTGGDGDTPEPVRPPAGTCGGMLSVTVSRGDDVTWETTWLAAGGHWWEPDEDGDAATPCSRELVEVMVAHAALHALVTGGVMADA